MGLCLAIYSVMQLHLLYVVQQRDCFNRQCRKSSISISTSSTRRVDAGVYVYFQAGSLTSALSSSNYKGSMSLTDITLSNVNTPVSKVTVNGKEAKLVKLNDVSIGVRGMRG